VTDPRFRGDRFPFHACGEDVTIYEWVRILDAERLTVGSHVIIDDFVLIDPGEGSTFGSHVHIASFVSMTGGGRFDIGDFAGIATGSRLLSGTDFFDGSGLTGPTIPPRWRSLERTFVRIGRHAVLGANVIVHPGITVGEGAIVGSNSLVTGDLPPWTISTGSPARPVKQRPRETIDRFERELAESERASP
jgi:galactoside O-acetyltransferase